MKIGLNFTTGKNCRLEVFSSSKTKLLVIGNNVQINDNCHITATTNGGVTIGNDVLIASKVLISDTNHGIYSGNGAHSDPRVPPANRPLVSAPVQIGDRVWLGDGVVVLSGVSIGAGTVVGANAVVVTDLPENSLAVGVPAKIIKEYNIGSGQWKNVK